LGRKRKSSRFFLQKRKKERGNVPPSEIVVLKKGRWGKGGGESCSFATIGKGKRAAFLARCEYKHFWGKKETNLFLFCGKLGGEDDRRPLVIRGPNKKKRGKKFRADKGEKKKKTHVTPKHLWDVRQVEKKKNGGGGVNSV